jgi:hypothetical protein
MISRGFARFTFSLAGAFAVAGLFASPALAQDHAHGGPAQNALVKVVREITGRTEFAAAEAPIARSRSGA